MPFGQKIEAVPHAHVTEAMPTCIDRVARSRAHQPRWRHEAGKRPTERLEYGDTRADPSRRVLRCECCELTFAARSEPPFDKAAHAARRVGLVEMKQAVHDERG